MEEITISLENRIRLGKLIRVYQKEFKMTQADLIQGICSRQVITNMGKGIIAKNEETYLELLRRFNLSYDYHHTMDDKVLAWSKDIRYALEWYRLDEVKRICEEAMSELEPYLKYAIELETYKVFELIHKYYFIDKSIENESEHFLRIMWLLNNDLCDVAKHAVFVFYYYNYHFGDKSNHRTQEVREQINLSKSVYPVLMLVEASCLIILRKYFEVFRLLTYLEKYYEQNNNYNGMLDTYSGIIFLINNVQENSLDVYANKIHDLYRNHKQYIDEEKALLIFSNLGKCYFDQKCYIEAKECFLQSIKFNRTYYASCICLNYLYSELNEDVPHDLFEIPSAALKEHHLKPYYDFYLLKHQNAEPSVLKSYLKEQILRKMSKDNFYYRIFTRELEKLS